MEASSAAQALAAAVQQEEVARAADRVVSEARSIQELLKTYAENTRQLQEDTAKFSAREAEEQSQFNALAAAVAKQEISSLQNTAYVRYTHSRREVDVDGEAVLPTQRMREQQGASSPSAHIDGRRKLGELWWFSQMKSTRFAHWAPDSAVSLRGYGDVREVLQGWRKPTSSSAADFEDLQNTLFPEGVAMGECAAAVHEEALTCFANGFLFYPQKTASRVTEVHLREEFNRVGGGGHDDASASALLAYTNCVTLTSALTKGEFDEIWRSAEDQATAGDNTRLFLCGDEHDCIAVVHPAHLQNTQLFRAFFMADEVVAVEHIGAQVDVLGLLVSQLVDDDGSSALGFGKRKRLREAAQRRLVNTFAQLYEACDCSGRPGMGGVVMIAAIAQEPLTDFSGDSAALSHRRGVVLDVRPLTPAIPFSWHLSWGEVCAIGQVVAGERTVLFKAGHVPAACLEPCDALSSLLFPTVNTVLLSEGQAVAAVERGEVGTHDTKKGERIHYPHAVGVAVAAASAGAVLAGAWVLKKHQ